MNRTNRWGHITVHYIKNIMGIFMAIVIFWGITQLLTYLYRTTDSGGYRLTWHYYYEAEGKITNLFLGSSHVHRDIDPRILDEMTGEYNFDLGTNGQRLNGTYYLLREAEKNNTLKHVYVEMYYLCSVENNFAEDMDPIDIQYDRNWQNTDYMKMSANRLAYMLSIAGADRYTDIFLPFCRYRSKLGDWEYVKNNIENKNQEEYISYQSKSYLGKGFYGGETCATDKDKCCEQIRILDEHPIGRKSYQYIHQIILYCQKRNIPITLFISPMDDLKLVSTVNYDNYINEIESIAAKYEIPFYDFNLAKEAYLPIQSNEYYLDTDHLNLAGAKLFSSFLGQVIQQDVSENKKYFYDSYAEKLRETPPAVYGIYYRDMESDSGETFKKVYVASNRDADMQYRIILTPEEGTQYTVQEFNKNKEFVVSSEEHGICTIVARMADHPDKIVQTLEINY